MSEKKRIWQPLRNIEGAYWFEFVVDSREFIKNGNCTKISRIIKFRLRNDTQENKNIDIIFNDIASYRITNESYDRDSVDVIENEKELKSKGVWGFYTIENSSFIAFIEGQTGIPSTIYNFKHYRIITIDDYIDIIASCEPKVELFVDGKAIESSDPEHRSLD
jgi:hypothetical protein